MNARITRPQIPLTDPAFKYTPASKTDLRATFARIALEHANPKTVRPICRKTGGK